MIKRAIKTMGQKITRDIARRYAGRAIPLAKSGLKAVVQSPLATTKGSVKAVAKGGIVPALIWGASEYAYKTGKKFITGVREYNKDTKDWVSRMDSNDKNIKMSLSKKKSRLVKK